MEERKLKERMFTMEEDYEFIENSEDSENEILDKFQQLSHRNFMRTESTEKIKINLSLEKINQHAKPSSTQRKHSLQPYLTINPYPRKSSSSEKLTLPEIILTPYDTMGQQQQSSPSPETYVDNQLSGADTSNHSSGHSSANGFYSDDNGDKPYTLNLMSRNLNPIIGNSSKKGG